MTRCRLRSLVALLPSIVVSAVAVACTSSSFQGGSGKAPGKLVQPAPQATQAPKPGQPANDTDDAAPDGETTETFDVTLLQGRLDMVWVIDNSASMTEEAAHVRENFSRFTAMLDSRADVKLALLSTTDSGSGGFGSTGVSLTSAQLAAGHVQIEVNVGSNDPLMIAAAASCPADSTDPIVDDGFDASVSAKLCGKDLSGIDPFLLNTAGLNQHKGSLTSFFREGAVRTYVVVTDDEAIGVDASNFVELVQPHMGASTTKPVMYAFRGVESRNGCSVANVGKAYEDLATATGGKVFDICEPSWDQYFAVLAKASSNLANSTFTLKFADRTVAAVEVDGKVLEAAQYKIEGMTLTIVPGVVGDKAKQVAVRYAAKN